MGRRRRSPSPASSCCRASTWRCPGRALAGDALALAGGALAAGYVRVGAEVRRTVPNPVYTLGCYGVAGVLLGLACLGGGEDLAGFDARTWWVIVALTVGPQLLGHSVFNRVLPDVGPTVVSVAVLLEVVGAALLAWWWFGEVPPAAAIPATALILAGVGLVVVDARARAHRRPRLKAVGMGVLTPKRPPVLTGGAVSRRRAVGRWRCGACGRRVGRRPGGGRRARRSGGPCVPTRSSPARVAETSSPSCTRPKCWTADSTWIHGPRRTFLDST